FFLARRTVNDSLWEFLAPRFTVPLLECFVRNLSLHEKLGELAPLSFALERHYASRITMELYWLSSWGEHLNSGLRKHRDIAHCPAEKGEWKAQSCDKA